MKRILFLLFLCLASLSSVYSVITPSDNNARAYFNFSNAGLDATGRFTTITATGTPTAVDGIIGQAYEYDGTENYDVGSVPVSAYPFTFNAWINKTSNLGAANSEEVIVSIGNSTVVNRYLHIGVEGGLVGIYARSGGLPTETLSSVNITGDGWVMITGVFNSASDRRLYINGTNVINSSASHSMGDVNLFSVGQASNTQGSQFFLGAIDEVSVFNESLNQQEINRLYNNGVGCTWDFFNCLVSNNLTNNTNYNRTTVTVNNNLSNTNGSILYSFRLNESDSEFNDGALTNFNTNDGTVNGDVYINQSDYSLKFDGNNDYLVMDNESNFDLQNFTISYYIKPASFGSRMDLVSKGEASYITSITAGGFPNMWVHDGSYRQIVASSSITAGEWTHVLYRYNRDNAIYDIYINGQLSNSVDPSAYGSLSNNALPLTFGVKSSSSLINDYNGDMTNLIIMDRAVSDSEINQTRYGRLNYSGVGDGLIAQYSGRDFNGTLDAPTDILDTNMIVYNNVSNSNGVSFDGVDDYIKTNDEVINSYPVTATGWVNLNNLSGDNGILTFGDEAAANIYLAIWNNAGEKFRVGGVNGAGQQRATSTSTVSTDIWYYITGIWYNSTYREIYVNTSLEASDTGSIPFPSAVDNIALGSLILNAQFWELDGKVSNWKVYNKALNSTEITTLYNGGEILDGQIWAQGDVNINEDTLYDRLYKLCYFCDTALKTLQNLEENVVYKYLTYAYNSLGVSNTGFKVFSIDLTSPSLNVTSFTEINSYNFNWTNGVINYSDINLDTCLVITEGNSFSCTNQSYTFSINGNNSFNVSVNDTAGNTAVSNGNTIFVNANQSFYFNKSTSGGLITSYNIILPNGTTQSVSGTRFSIPIYEVGLGTWNFTFYKSGYNNNTFQVVFNTTSNYNLTTPIIPTTLTMTMFDADTLTQIYFNATILNDSTSQIFTGQHNFSKNYSEIPTGDIEIIIESDGYSDAYFYNTITPFTSITINGYLIPVNDSTVVTFTTLDQTTDNALSNVIVEAQQLINGTYTTISQATTGNTGQTFMYLDTSIVYKFIFSKDGYVQGEAFAIPLTTSYVIRLEPTTQEYTFIDGVSYSFTPVGDTLYNDKNYTFNGFITGTSLTSMYYELVDQNGTIIYNASSINPTGTTFTYQWNNLNASNFTFLNQSITYVKDGITTTVFKTYTTTTITNSSFIYYLKYEVSLEDNEETNIFLWLLLVISMGASFLVGRSLGGGTLGGSLASIIVIWFLVYIEFVDALYGGAITVLALLLYVALGGGFRR